MHLGRFVISVVFCLSMASKMERKVQDEDGKRQGKALTVTDSWLTKVKERFESGAYTNRRSSEGVCIFKVPQSIKDFKPEAYNPEVVHFGPFKFSEDLSAMDDYKLKAVAATCKRINDMRMEELLDKVKGWENEIRDCYQDRAVEWTTEALAWMITMDACFILEFFKKHESAEEFSLIFGVKDHHTIIKSEILKDILKLENQIPLFVLTRIYQLQFSDSQLADEKFAKELYVYEMFKGFPFISKELPKDWNWKKLEEYIRRPPFHLLDLWTMVIGNFLLPSHGPPPSPPRDDKQDKKRKSLPTAKKLAKAGISFAKSEDGKIQFEQRYLSFKLFLPQITIDDRTETSLRNLMALEECRWCCFSGHGKPSPRKISYYVSILNDLIENKEDVEQLRKGNIIQSFVGSDEEIAEMFNTIGKELTAESYPQYDKELNRVVDCQNMTCYEVIHSFKDRYFRKPWYAVSVVVAILILGMTAIQTIYSVKHK